LILQHRTANIQYDHLISIIAGSYDKITFSGKVLVNYRVHQTSATYTVPVMDRSGKRNRRLSNIIRSFFRTFRLYFEIRSNIREWFVMVYDILKSLPEDNTVKADAQKIAFYQSQSGIINYIKLTCMYVKVRTNLFHVVEKDNLFTLLRALYYPISCSDYFRYMSRRYAKK